MPALALPAIAKTSSDQIRSTSSPCRPTQPLPHEYVGAGANFVAKVARGMGRTRRMQG